MVWSKAGNEIATKVKKMESEREREKNNNEEKYKQRCGRHGCKAIILKIVQYILIVVVGIVVVVGKWLVGWSVGFLVLLDCSFHLHPLSIIQYTDSFLFFHHHHRLLLLFLFFLLNNTKRCVVDIITLLNLFIMEKWFPQPK